MAAFRPVSARPVAALAANSAALAASLAGQATLTAALSTGIPLAANFAVQATMTGSIPTGLVAAFAARATLGATLSTGIPLAANLAAQASTTAALSTGIQLAAFMGVNASLNGGLTAGPAADPSSWLCDDTELISGAWLASAYPGHGVLGVNVPSEGTDGPSALYGVLSLPADNAVEVRGLITRWPVNGTLTIEEDGSFNYSGTTDYFEFLLYAGGVASTVNIGYGAGISRITLQVGAGGGAQQLAFEVEMGHDNPHIWWKRKPKKIDEVTAEAKLKEVAEVIKAKAEKHAKVNASKAYRKADTLEAVKPLIEDMPGFDWQPMYADAYNDALNGAILSAASDDEAAKYAQMLEDDDIAVLLAAL